MKFASGSLLPLTIAIPTSMIVGGLAQSNNNAGWTTASNGVSIAAGVAVTLALQELVIKPLVRRERPYRALDSVRWVDSSATGYSFPSSHAATSWGLAVGLSLRYPKWYVIGPSVAYALVVSLSRPYLGVHFPSDVLTGAVLGSLVQYAFYKFQYWPKTPRSSTGAYFSSAAVRGPIGLGIALPLGN
ncbi:MAG: phosphatase PAP2 family protein [Bacteroidetes bacterium]|nr:phosphatase PAP2 family protein [Bacteroidota bacterium]